MAAPAAHKHAALIRGAVLTLAVVSFLGIFRVADLLIGPLFPGDGVFDDESRHILAVGDMVGPCASRYAQAWFAWDAGGTSPWPLVAIHMLIDVTFITFYGSLLISAARSASQTFGRVGRALTYALPLAILVAESLEMWLLAAAATSLRAAESGVGFPVWLATAFGTFEPVKVVLFYGAWIAVAISAIIAARRRRR